MEELMPDFKAENGQIQPQAESQILEPALGDSEVEEYLHTVIKDFENQQKIVSEKSFYDVLAAEDQAKLDYKTLKFLILEKILPFSDLLVLVARQFHYLTQEDVVQLLIKMLKITISAPDVDFPVLCEILGKVEIDEILY